MTQRRKTTRFLCKHFEAAVAKSCPCAYNIYSCLCHDESSRDWIDYSVYRSKSLRLSRAWESQFDEEKKEIEAERQRQEIHQQAKERSESLRASREAQWNRNEEKQLRLEAVDSKETKAKEIQEAQLKSLIADVGSLKFGQMQDAFRTHYQKEIAPEFATLLDYQMVEHSVRSSLESKLGEDVVDLILAFIPEDMEDWLEFRAGCDLDAEEYAHEQFTGDRVFDAHFLKCSYDHSVMYVHSDYGTNALTFSTQGA